MKVSKSLIGQFVEITWADPVMGARRLVIREAPRGRAALGSWRERGVIDDITEGIIRIQHSVGTADPRIDPDDEAVYTWVVEDLVERIDVFVKKEQEGGSNA